ncbi:MAG: hypothetical protein GY946_23105 [bacterium]|nr:hypothetical protein [bacterium]
MTDADGRFMLENVPSGDAYLQLSGDQIVTTQHNETRGEDNGFTIEVPVRCRVRIMPSDLPEFDLVSFLDGEGKVVPMLSMSTNQVHCYQHWSLKEGHSAILVVGDNATALGHYRNGRLIEKLPVVLSPEKVTEIIPN